jgi:hypothetical protein
VKVKEEARKTFESLLEDFAGYKANIEDDEKRESMEYDREEIDNLVYSIRKVETYELQLAGGGPAYWIQFDVEGQYGDYTISNIKFKYAWWSEPVLISYYNMSDEEYKMMEWFVEEFIGGDVSWLESYN